MQKLRLDMSKDLWLRILETRKLQENLLHTGIWWRAWLQPTTLKRAEKHSIEKHVILNFTLSKIIVYRHTCFLYIFLFTLFFLYWTLTLLLARIPFFTSFLKVLYSFRFFLILEKYVYYIEFVNQRLFLMLILFILNQGRFTGN